MNFIQKDLEMLKNAIAQKTALEIFNLLDSARKDSKTMDEFLEKYFLVRHEYLWNEKAEKQKTP